VPPPPIRVLVVDDSVVIRRLVTGVLEGDPDIEVVGTAVDGAAALRALDRLKPDLVTLDVEMPVMDGLATLKELRKVAPRLPVIMFSTLPAR
jgi:two-component system chemotaxis response regulator CheB